MSYFIKAGLWKKAKLPLAGELDLTRLINSGGSDPSTATGFTGEFSLSNILGTYWGEFSQSGAIVFTESSLSTLGGTDIINIIANGDTITVPSEWINMGSTDISIVDGTKNRIIVTKTNGEIWYSVVVES